MECCLLADHASEVCLAIATSQSLADECPACRIYVDAHKIEDRNVDQVQDFCSDGGGVVLRCGTGDRIKLIDQLTQHDTKQWLWNSCGNGKKGSHDHEQYIKCGVVQRE